MLLKQCSTGHLIEVLDQKALFDPSEPRFQGRLNVGEDMPEPELFEKKDVCFPSGESLPRCWVDIHYRDKEIRH